MLPVNVLCKVHVHSVFLWMGLSVQFCALMDNINVMAFLRSFRKWRHKQTSPINKVVILIFHVYMHKANDETSFKSMQL